MANAKAEAIGYIKRLPKDVSSAEIVYKLYVKQKIDEGLRDLEEGRVMSHEELLREMVAWRKSVGRPVPAKTSKKSKTPSRRTR